MLENVDILAYDMQDVGARFYTYINTLAYAMEACAENNKTFVVFDRPNPLGGEAVQGNILDLNYSSFVGMYPIVQRYGLTIGEYAKFINDEFNINCDLKVVEMTNWTRDMYYDETGLDTWVMPSPNMPTLDTAIVYTGTCLFEGTNVSEGRGTTRPFELIGAPWIKPLELANALNSLNLPGVKFRAASFTPSFSKYGSTYDSNGNKTKNGELCGGVQVYVTDRDEFNAVKVGLAMVYTIRDMYPDNFEYLSNNFIDKLFGDSYLREGKYTLEELFEIIDRDSNEFKEKTKQYHLYNEVNEENNHNKDAIVKLGIDNIDNYLDVFKDKKVGLITNPSGMDSDFTSSIDVLYERTELTTLFAAEHGIRGNAQAGDNVGNEVDEITGLPVHSLYGSNKKPTAEMLENVDILAYDMQDVGARFYTYINTLAYAMEACAENNKTFVVFDRPNPVGGEAVQGTILDSKYSSFVGMYPIVQRYGLTIGEYAKYINNKFNINCDLKVIEMSGWKRDMYYDDTALNTWVMPSPNMPTLNTAIVYTGTCLFEGTNVSEGRGTTRPFELIGAPWIKPLELANALNSLNLPGVKFRAASFTPQFSKYGPGYDGKAAQVCGGVQVYVTNREEFNSAKVGLAMLYTIRDMYPDNFEYLSTNFIDKLAGNSYVREGKYTLEELFEIVDKESLEFSEEINDYKIYGKDVVIVNKEALMALVDKINSLNKENYTSSTWRVLEIELEESTNIVSNEKATQEEVDIAYNELMNAYSSLVLKPDKSTLENLIKSISEMDLSKYTKESINNLNIQLEKAKEILANNDATEADIAEVIKNVEKAKSDLVILSNNASNQGSNTGNNNSKLPSTGAVVSSFAIIALALGAIILGIFIMKKKKDV